MSDGTGVPVRFVVTWAAAVSDWQAVEAVTHDLLAHWRVNESREFFRCSADESCQAIERAVRAYRRPWWRKLLLGPRRAAARDRRRAGRARGDPLRRPMIVVLLLLVGLLAWFKPVLPTWLPPSLIRVGYLVERLHR